MSVISSSEKEFIETQRQRYRMAVSFRHFASSSASSPPQLAPARFDPERTRPGNTNTYTHTTPLDTHIIIATSALLFLLLAVLFLNFVIRWLLRRFYHASLFPSHDSEAQKRSDAQKGLTKTQLQSLPTLVFSYASEVSDKTHVLSIKIESRTDKEDTIAASTCGKEGKEDHVPSVGMVESQNERNPGVDDDDDSSSSSSCPICLAKFVSGEIIRLLPTCHHRFHSICIDTWLSKHSSCPACRADLIVATKHTSV